MRGTIPPKIAKALERVELYMGRAEEALEGGDPLGALRHLAEAVEIGQRVWEGLSAEEVASDAELDRAFAKLVESEKKGGG